jgi:hypothetical protein
MEPGVAKVEDAAVTACEPVAGAVFANDDRCGVLFVAGGDRAMESGVPETQDLAVAGYD